MANLINWCNVNQGFVFAVLTLAYVIATFVMVRKMHRSNRLLLDLEKERSRPAVVFNILWDNYTIYASMKNIGLTPAYDIAVTCSPTLRSLTDGRESAEIALTTRPVTFLAPQQAITDIVDYDQRFEENYPNPIFAGYVYYKDMGGREYRETFRIDLTVMREVNPANTGDVATELHRIRNSIDRLQLQVNVARV